MGESVKERPSFRFSCVDRLLGHLALPLNCVGGLEFVHPTTQPTPFPSGTCDSIFDRSPLVSFGGFS